MKPPAIGYLRSDISGVSKAWDQIQIRTTAERLGYEPIKTIEFSEFTADPVGQLLGAIARDKVDAVVVPSIAHLGGEIPEALMSAADVITVSPEATYARRLPSLFDPPASQGDLHGDSHSRDRVPAAGGRGLAGVRRPVPPLT
ncbi:hypothetical protein ACTWPB_07720 [Nocardia sp. IBHARD005]|uniref:hypothetical protein n=1 Tax=Nocardia sp. IBHARD005 TaxID=3457765 RepID=UPI0040592C3D